MIHGKVFLVSKHHKHTQLVLDNPDGMQVLRVCEHPNIQIGDSIWTQCGHAYWTSADRSFQDRPLQMHRIDWGGQEMCDHTLLVDCALPSK